MSVAPCSGVGGFIRPLALAADPTICAIDSEVSAPTAVIVALPFYNNADPSKGSVSLFCTMWLKQGVRLSLGWRVTLTVNPKSIPNDPLVGDYYQGAAMTPTRASSSARGRR